MLREMQDVVDEVEGSEGRMIILGDFNAHLGYVGFQEENENGSIVNEFIEKNSIILLNLDEKCIGEYTWQRREQRSAIDFILANEGGYSRFRGMTIDEARNEIDLSDHCLVTARFGIRARDDGN